MWAAGLQCPGHEDFCPVCHGGQPGDEVHLVFECPGLGYIRLELPWVVWTICWYNGPIHVVG